MVQIAPYAAQHLDGLHALWSEAFPNDPPRNQAAQAVRQKLAFQPGLLFVALNGETVIGSVMAGYDGHRGWLYAIAVSQKHQRQGLGSKLVSHGEDALKKLGCNKINLQVRTGNECVKAFYEKLGYNVEPRVSLGKSFD